MIKTALHNALPPKIELIGREEELSQLLQLCSVLKQNSFGGVVYLYGESGIGKSLLLRKLMEQVKNECFCAVFLTDNIIKKSFYPFIYFLQHFFFPHIIKEDEKHKQFDTLYKSLIEELFNHPDKNKSQPIITDLQRNQWILKKMMGLGVEDLSFEQLDTKGRFDLILYTLKSFFTGLSLIKPTILILEDLHWIDKDSLLAFETLLRNIESYPLILICSSRIENPKVIPRLKVDQTVSQTEIHLNPLTYPHTTELMKRTLKKNLSPKWINYLYSKIGGNPFLVEQTCLYLKENNLLKQQNHVFVLKNKLPEVIDNPHKILSIRLQHMSLKLQQTANIAAVLGKEFNITLLNQILTKLQSTIGAIKDISDDKKQDNILSTFSSENIKDILLDGENEELWVALTDGEYSFKHNLMQNAAYDSLQKNRLRLLHKMAGEAIESAYPDNPKYYVDLAYHYEKAHLKNKACQYLYKAANYSQDNFNNHEAALLWKRLLTLTSCIKDKVPLYLNLCRVYYHMGDVNNGVELAKIGMDCAERVKDIANGLQLQLLRISLVITQTNYQEAVELIHNALQTAQIYNEQEVIAKLYNLTGQIYFLKGEYQTALENYSHSLNVYQDINHRLGISSVKNNIGLIYKLMGNFAKALDFLNSSLNLIENKDIRLEFQVLGNIGGVYECQGENEKAEDYIQKALKQAQKTGDKLRISMCLNNLGNIYYNKGLMDKSLEYYMLSMHTQREISNKKFLAGCLQNITSIYIRKAKFNKAIEYNTEALTLAKAISDRRTESNIYATFGELYFYQCQYDKALHYYSQALSTKQEIGVKSELDNIIFMLFLVHFEKKEYSKALSVLNNYIKHYLPEERKEEVDILLYSMKAILSIVGYENNPMEMNQCDSLLYIITDKKSAESCFKKAIKLSKQMNNPKYTVLLLYYYGRYFLNQGNTDEAVNKINMAMQKADKLGLEADYNLILMFCKQNKIDLSIRTK